MPSTAEFPRPAAHRTTLTVRCTADSTVVSLVGELDLADVPRLREVLADELALQPAALFVDLSAVSFCSVRILELFLEFGRAAASAGVAFALITERRAILRPLRVLGLDLPVHRTLEEATPDAG